MEKIRQEGKTVAEAVQIALGVLDIEESEAEVKVIEEGNKGFLGILGSKSALVEVEKKKNPVEIGKKFLEDVFSTVSLDVEVELLEKETDSNQITYNLKSSDLGIIIGHRGENLDALQYLTSLVVNKNYKKYIRIMLDAEGYRERRKQTLIRLANKLAKKCINKGRKVVLEPMPPHERRIIHIAIKENPRVTSFSEGKEPFRKVKIVEKNDNE